MKKQPEVTAQTRENLLNAFWQLYKNKPLNEITVQNVTERAGYNRCTFYAYFHSIRDIQEEFENALISYIRDNVANRLLPAILRDEMPDLSTLYMHTKGEYLRVLLGENSDPRFTSKLKYALCETYFEMLDLQPDDVFAAYLLNFSVSGLLAVLAQWYSRNDLSESEVSFLLHDFLINGALTTYANIQNNLTKIAKSMT